MLTIGVNEDEVSGLLTFPSYLDGIGMIPVKLNKYFKFSINFKG
jgi:hypothetical protein